jgi:TonB family protein
MIKRSWFFQNGFYFTLLALVLLLHVILLSVKLIRMQRVSSTDSTSPPLKVRLIDTHRQIVDAHDPETLTKPSDKAYLSNKDRAVERQTRARRVDSFKSGGKGSMQLSDLGAFSKSYDPLKTAAKHARKSGGSGNQRGVSSSNDHLLDVPLGDLTYLNTVEYKYYGYYHRIKQKLEQFWGRSIFEKAQALAKSGRRVASEEELITALIIVLDSEGEILSISVKGSSGVKELDDAAIESFNQAGPFPNPPKDLIVDGRVKIEWGFVVKT